MYLNTLATIFLLGSMSVVAENPKYPSYLYAGHFENSNVASSLYMDPRSDDSDYVLYLTYSSSFDFYYNDDGATYRIENISFGLDVETYLVGYDSLIGGSVTHFQVNLISVQTNVTFADKVYTLKFNCNLNHETCTLSVSSDGSLDGSYTAFILDDEYWRQDYYLQFDLDCSQVATQLEQFVDSTRDYSQGYTNGYNDGYSQGSNDGYQNGKNDGFTEGVTYSQNQNQTALTIFQGIITIGLLPINFFLAMLNFEVFGINIGGAVSALLTIAIVVIIIRIVVSGGSGGKDK